MEDLKKYNPQYQHINDTLSFVVHLSFLKQNCKLIGLAEEQYLEDLGSIPQGWNKSNEIYQFRYIIKNKNENKNKKEEQKGNENINTILVKILSMEENNLLITAVKQNKNSVFTLEINLNDHININKASKNLNDYKIIYKDINSLIVLINDQITNKLIKKPKDENNDKNKKNKKDDNKPNPLIFPDPNPNPNPLFIGGGRGGYGGIGGGIPFGGGGGYGDDINPGGQGGNLMGQRQIHNQWKNKNNNNNKPPLVPPNARFDPMGPGGGFPGGPDPDHFKPPGGGRGGGFNDGLGGFGGGGFM